MSRNVEIDFKNCQDRDHVENQDFRVTRLTRLALKNFRDFRDSQYVVFELSRLNFLIKTTSKIKTLVLRLSRLGSLNCWDLINSRDVIFWTVEIESLDQDHQDKLRPPSLNFCSACRVRKFYDKLIDNCKCSHLIWELNLKKSRQLTT
jgi:hypothetical protein